MPDCVSCSTELDPLWKYCVTCGTPVVSAEPRAPIEAEPIPGAIRPQQQTMTARVRAIPTPAIVVIALAVLGIVGSVVAVAFRFG